MKRRKFLNYGMFASSSFLLSFADIHWQSFQPSLASSGESQLFYEWIFLYWMPYDNDLSPLGESILEMLRRSVQSENILVIVQADFFEADHLSRYVISKNQFHREFLETSDSSDSQNFAEYLIWASSQFAAQKWAIIFLGHGGKLDEISPDEHPHADLRSDLQWMNIQSIRDAIATFNRRIRHPVELLFFQNCNKGTLEVHYTFRDVAAYTLSSQLLLGAPNAYYEDLFTFLGNYSIPNGAQLAEKIMEFEAPEMYHSYTVINHQNLGEMADYLKAMIEEILLGDLKKIDLKEIEQYEYMGDTYVDLIEFFQKVRTQSQANPEAYEKFANFLQNSVIEKRRIGGQLLSLTSRQRYQHFSGVGLFFPLTKAALEQYGYLSIFQDLKLATLFSALLER